MLTDPPPTTHTPRKGAELQWGPEGQPPGLEDVAPPHLPQSPWRQARSAGPASFAAYSASLLPWQQRTAGRDGDGSEYRIGPRLCVLGKAREADSLPPFTPRPCILVRVCLSSALNLCLSVSLYLCLILAFSLSHISLIRPLTFTTHPPCTSGSLCAPCLCPPGLHSHRWGGYPHSEEATGTGVHLLSALSIIPWESLRCSSESKGWG